MIKPHGQHERDFVFTPKISGRFCETLRIENLQVAYCSRVAFQKTCILSCAGVACVSVTDVGAFECIVS